MKDHDANRLLIDKYLQQGILISPDIIGSAIDDTLFQDIENISSLGFTVLLKDLLGCIKKDSAKDINWRLYEKARVLYEKKKDKGVYTKLVALLDQKCPVVKSENQRSEENELDSVQVIADYDERFCRNGVKDFVSHFNKRYKEISNILRKRQELDKLTSISRVKKMDSNEPVSIVGMVVNKNLTKNGHLIIDIEDQTGVIRILVHNSREDIFSEAQEISLDEVIGVVGSSGKGIVFVNNIIWPDIPLDKEIKKSPVEEYALFIGDIHIGNKCFLKKDFEKFIDWLNGKAGTSEQKEIASKINYLIIVGDLVDGVGIYPGQEDDLDITDIYGQYEALAKYLKQVPSRIKIIVCGGNHDAMRIAEPQPALYEDFGRSIYDLPNAVVVSNPAIVNIGKRKGFPGFSMLFYHGYSFPYYADAVPSIRQAGGLERTDLILQYLLKRRHLAPAHGSSLYIPAYEKDPLVISSIPDILVTGHIHRATISKYKKIICLNCSCWLAQTDYQEKVGLKPEPSKAILLNMQTRNAKILSFGET